MLPAGEYSTLSRYRLLTLNLALAAGISGCAIVERVHRDGSETRSVVFGAPVYQEFADAQAKAVSARGLGLGMMSGTVTLGWFDSKAVALDDSCRVVLIGNSDEQLANFNKLTGNRSDICEDRGGEVR